MNFCDIKHHVNILVTEKKFENLLLQTSDLKESSSINLEQFKTVLVDCSYRCQNTKLNNKSLITKNHRDALKELRMNKDIIMIRPDKRSEVVLLDRTA